MPNSVSHNQIRSVTTFGMFSVQCHLAEEVPARWNFYRLSGLREAGFIEPRLMEAPSVSPLVLANKPD